MKELFLNKSATVKVPFFSDELKKAFEQIVEEIVGAKVQVDVSANLSHDLFGNEYYEMVADISAIAGGFTEERFKKLDRSGLNPIETESRIFSRLIEILAECKEAYAAFVCKEEGRFKLEVCTPYDFYKKTLAPEDKLVFDKENFSCASNPAQISISQEQIRMMQDAIGYEPGRVKHGKYVYGCNYFVSPKEISDWEVLINLKLAEKQIVHDDIYYRVSEKGIDLLSDYLCIVIQKSD